MDARCVVNDEAIRVAAEGATKKAEYAEKMRNQMATIHKEAEEKRASVEAKRQEEVLRYQETAAKHRSTGTTPKKKFLQCFG
jgi:hypothetical protein